MKRCIFYTSLFSLLSISSFAQTQFWSDSFEDAGSPSSGSRTPSVEFGCGSPAGKYFFRTAPSGIALQSGSYSNFDGSKIWAGEDIDNGPTCTSNSISPNQQVTWSGININGLTGLSFKGLFACNGVNGGWDGSNFAPNNDRMEVEYRIDGGAWTKILGFYAGAVTSTSALMLDTNGDMVGDGASLGYSFTEFTATIPATGSTLDLRFNCSSNGTAAEEFAVDNFRLFYSTSLPIQLSTFTVKELNGNNKLNWTTASEQNSRHFEVERNYNGKDFFSIGTVAAVGNSNSNQQYSFTDVAPFEISYYRLKQTDIDGKFEYSNIVTAKLVAIRQIMIYPNPFVNDLISIKSSLLSDPHAQVRLFDINGRITAISFTGSGSQRTGNLSSLPKGIYLVQIECRGKTFSRKIVKQ